MTTTETKTYDITFVNEAKGGVVAHAAGCADLKFVGKGNHNEIAGTISATSKRDAFLEYNSDFIEGDDESNAWDIDFKNCTRHIPAEDLGETLEVDEDLIGDATDVKRGWPTCRCGCKARTQNSSSVYLPGHDARHAGQVARAAAARVIETTPTGRPLTFAVIDDEDMLDGLSPALKAKATAHIQRLLEKAANKSEKAARVAAQAEGIVQAHKSAQKVGSVKIGRWTYPVRNAAGLAQRNTKRDGSGEWVAVEPSQIVTYN